MDHLTPSQTHRITHTGTHTSGLLLLGSGSGNSLRWIFSDAPSQTHTPLACCLWGQGLAGNSRRWIFSDAPSQTHKHILHTSGLLSLGSGSGNSMRWIISGPIHSHAPLYGSLWCGRSGFSSRPANEQQQGV